MDIGTVSLRARERAFLAGGTQVGKSTLADALRDDFLIRYRTAGGRCLILDSKPRYRAEWMPNGMTAKRLYKGWDHGQAVRDSVVVKTPADMLSAFRLGHRVAIAQADEERELPALVACAAAFLKDSRGGRPQLLDVDETGDFFHGNGQALGGSDAIIRTARAGAERGTSGLYCSQRTKGISPALMEHMDKLYAFRLDNKDDAKRFAEFGAPIGPDDLPRVPHVFYYWTKMDYDEVYGPYKLGRPAAA